MAFVALGVSMKRMYMRVFLPHLVPFRVHKIKWNEILYPSKGVLCSLPFLAYTLINKIKECLVDVGCAGPIMIGIVITLLPYVENIILLVRSHYVLSRNYKSYNIFAPRWVWPLVLKKTKFVIPKSKNITWDTFIYENNYLVGFPSYKYLEFNIHHKIDWIYKMEKRINGGWKAIMQLKTTIS